MVVAKVPDTKVGVKFDPMPMPDTLWVNPPVWDPPTFLDEIECELISARGGVVRGAENVRHAEDWHRRDPDGARVMAERHYGTGTTVADWIAREQELVEICKKDQVAMEETRAWDGDRGLHRGTDGVPRRGGRPAVR